jgi:uracil-DNA glycosylase
MWTKILKEEYNKPYMQDLMAFLEAEQSRGKIIYPAKAEWSAAFRQTPFEEVKVVLLGQDPYHTPGVAHGLSFSVREGKPVPPSLLNIYKELHQDLGIAPRSSGSLLGWAKQGVLLLNRVLTVEAGLAASHSKKGWEQFTDRILKELWLDKTPKVFLLFGQSAQKALADYPPMTHKVIRTAHPSPLAVHRGGFFGTRPFSAANTYLVQQGRSPIDWSL